QSQDNTLVPGHQPQGLESTGPFVIVLEQKGINLQRPEKLLGHSVVGAFGVPTASAVTTTDVQRAGEVIAYEPTKCGIVSGDGRVELPVRIQSSLPKSFALSRIKIVGVVRRIELDVGHALLDQPVNLVANNLNEIREERPTVGVDAIGNPCLVASEHEIGRCGQRNLERTAGGLSQEGHFIRRERTGPAKLRARNAGRGGLDLTAGALPFE